MPNDEDEVVEEIHMNDYSLRSKGVPSTSNSQSTSSLTTKNANVSKYSTTIDALNIEYNFMNQIQK